MWFLRAVCLHVLRKPLLHGVDTVAYGAWEGVQLWGLEREHKDELTWQGLTRFLTLSPLQDLGRLSSGDPETLPSTRHQEFVEEPDMPLST